MLRRLVDRILETPTGYGINRILAGPTTRRLERLIGETVSQTPGRSVLDIGCGTGDYSPMLVGAGSYVGVDINPAYVESARARFPQAQFETMNAAFLDFSAARFDEVISVATTHHLNDKEVAAMTREALRVVRPGGAFHIFDAILPVNPHAYFKTAFFKMDRGRFARKADALIGVVRECGQVTAHKIVLGPLHDVIYVKIEASPLEERSRPKAA
jgi:ubiquinone/menaquinone biosynthesis C-methylase UbiE